ncbi:MAG TPA: hypothetical protein VHX38_32150 [Pseudonocardiaceae bacterium]|nr:hypothetical protein [Pseudonocardiaceae bacterium]
MDPSSLVAQWLRYATANKVSAEVRAKSGDLFGAELARTRGEVRRAAALLLQEMRADPLGAAKVMHERAAAIWVRDLPLIGFDAAALTYTKARTWQDCARAIDPELPIVQQRLTWD